MSYTKDKNKKIIVRVSTYLFELIKDLAKKNEVSLSEETRILIKIGILKKDQEEN